MENHILLVGLAMFHRTNERFLSQEQNIKYFSKETYLHRFPAKFNTKDKSKWTKNPLADQKLTSSLFWRPRHKN